MAEKDDGGTAFPTFRGMRGMSLRDYFAAAALQGALSSSNRKEVLTIGPTEPNDNAKLARVAYYLADAMIKARKK